MIFFIKQILKSREAGKQLEKSLKNQKYAS